MTSASVIAAASAACLLTLAAKAPPGPAETDTVSPDSDLSLTKVSERPDAIRTASDLGES
jgi:hypothetical protein